MKTPTKKKAVKKKGIPSVLIPVPVHTLYELYRTKSGAWKFRKRARNGEILNHSYNSKALAIKGTKADFRLTKEMSELKWKEVK